MNFLELLDAYVLAERRYCLTENQRGPGNGPYGPNHPDSIEAAGEAVALRAEVEGRIERLRDGDDPDGWAMSILDGRS